MITYQRANAETRLKGIDLSMSIFKPNMGDQFTLLFSPKNQKHMFLALDGDKVVSMVNYYPTRITLDGIQFKVGSIGSVCTDSNYRGKQIASRLLEQAEKSMTKESIDFTIISGSGGIYEHFGARDVGHMIEYLIPKSKFKEYQTYKLREYQDTDFEDIYSLYQKETHRYIRTKNEFKTLLIAQRTPDSYCSYPMIVILKQSKVVGYVIFNYYKDAKDLWVKEFAGNRKVIFESISGILEYFQKLEIHMALSSNDKLNRLFDTKPHKIITQEASIKVIHKTQFIDKLNRYALKYNSNYNIEIVRDHYKITRGTKTDYISEDDLMRLVFSGKLPNATWTKNDICIMNFPLNLLWSHNLNYQ